MARFVWARRAGRLTATNGGFRPGQTTGIRTLSEAKQLAAAFCETDNMPICAASLTCGAWRERHGARGGYLGPPGPLPARRLETRAREKLSTRLGTLVNQLENSSQPTCQPTREQFSTLSSTNSRTVLNPFLNWLKTGLTTVLMLVENRVENGSQVG